MNNPDNVRVSFGVIARAVGGMIIVLLTAAVIGSYSFARSVDRELVRLNEQGRYVAEKLSEIGRDVEALDQRFRAHIDDFQRTMRNGGGK